MEFSRVFNKVTNLPYDQEFMIGGRELFMITDELRAMHEWEHRKEPQHPDFKPEYLDKINAYYGSVSPFLLVPFLKYMFAPYTRTNKVDILIAEEGFSLLFKKKYIGCDHDFITETIIVGGLITDEHDMGFSTERILCKNCGYQQVN